MTREEKIDKTYDMVLHLTAEWAARKEICETIHEGIDTRISGLHRVIRGNGQPGLEQKFEALKTDFSTLKDNFTSLLQHVSIVETRIATILACVFIVIQWLAPVVVPKLKAAMHLLGA